MDYGVAFPSQLLNHEREQLCVGRRTHAPILGLDPCIRSTFAGHLTSYGGRSYYSGVNGRDSDCTDLRARQAAPTAIRRDYVRRSRHTAYLAYW